MEREIDLILIVKELVHYIKQIIIFGLICALIFSVYMYMNAKSESASAQYASVSKIVVKDNKYNNNKETNGSNTIDTNLIASFFLSDTVVDETLKGIKNYDGSAADVRNMMYFVGKGDNSVEIYTVSNNSDVARFVNSEILKQGVIFLNEQGFNAQTVQNSTDMGAVNITNTTNNTNPNDIIYTINKVESTNIMCNSLKGILIGFVLGIIIACVYIMIRFITKDVIIYPEQIERSVGINVLNKTFGDNVYLSMYRDLKIINPNLKSIKVVPVGIKKDILKLIDKCIDALKAANINVISLNSEDFSRDENRHCEYDLIVIEEKDYKDSCFDSYIFTDVDEIILVLEPRTLKVDELIQIVKLYKKANKNIACVLMR